MVSKQVVGIPSPPHKQAFLERQIPDNIPFIITPNGYTPDLQSPGQRQFSERTVLRFSGEKKKDPQINTRALSLQKSQWRLWFGGREGFLPFCAPSPNLSKLNTMSLKLMVNFSGFMKAAGKTSIRVGLRQGENTIGS